MCWGIFTISETFSKSGDPLLIGRIIMPYLCLIREIVSLILTRVIIQAQFQRGDRGSGPPWDLSEVGSSVEDWWVGEGVQRLFLPHFYQFFLARFARQYYTNMLHVYILPWLMFSMERSSFLYNSRIQITSHPLLLWKNIFIFSCLELHDFTPFKPKNFWGRIPVPFSHTHIQHQNYHVISVFVERGLQLHKKTIPPYRKKTCM